MGKRNARKAKRTQRRGAIKCGTWEGEGGAESRDIWASGGQPAELGWGGGCKHG